MRARLAIVGGLSALWWSASACSTSERGSATTTAGGSSSATGSTVGAGAGPPTSATTSGAGAMPPGNGPTIAGCPVFPADNEWNREISTDEVDPKSDAIIAYINNNGGTKLHPDFGSNPFYGIPYVIVAGTQPKVPVSFQYASESDPGPYPIPPDAPIEGGPRSTGDRHILVIDKDNCLLYETFASKYVGPGWSCGSGAIWDLRSNKSRPAGWTSADAAGLPIFPGLVRYEQTVTAGEIKHAVRFTVAKTRRAYVFPATHYASNITDPNAPPMGMRVRLKASYDISGFTGPAKVILTGLKKYGMMLADNGSNWFISGTSHPMFDDDQLAALKKVPGSAFEVLKLGTIVSN